MEKLKRSTKILLVWSVSVDYLFCKASDLKMQ